MPANKQPVLVWFRRDLRIQDNPALAFAMASGQPVVPFYIYAPQEEKPWQPGGASRWWLHQSLQCLHKSLQKMGLTLSFFKGNSEQIIKSLIQDTRATALVWNNLYEPQIIKRDTRLEKSFGNIMIRRFDSGLFFTPGTLLNRQQQAYRVFTPFWKQARQLLDTHGVRLTTSSGRQPVQRDTTKPGKACSLAQLGLLDGYPWYEKLMRYWQPGENGAQQRLGEFLDHIFLRYKQDRDFPAVDGTSRLSAHLHFGEITPTQIYYQVQRHDFGKPYQASIERLLTELGWREFAHHVLWHFPMTAGQTMNDKFTNFWPARPNRRLLKKWQQGRTGIAIVDAGMRQLWETGWMHNRLRMIVGSLLTKNLGIHWLHGARWFWETLVDADLANNTLGWQWVAGCGVDAAPYYRIFNPDTQAERFDSKRDYIRRWLPQQADAPHVDLKQTREAALQRYRAMR